MYPREWRLDTKAVGVSKALLQARQNPAAEPGKRLYERFMAAWAWSASKKMKLVFHGTPQQNVAAILENGLDPNRRGASSGQRLGQGEYKEVGVLVQRGILLCVALCECLAKFSNPPFYPGSALIWVSTPHFPFRSPSHVDLVDVGGLDALAESAPCCGPQGRSFHLVLARCL